MNTQVSKYNALLIEGKYYPVDNRTIYSPDAIAEKHANAMNSTVAKQMADRVEDENGMTEGKAAQDIFDRAVKFVESERKKLDRIGNPSPNHQVTIDEKGTTVEVFHRTVYYPDSVIKKYLEKKGLDMETEIQKLRKSKMELSYVPYKRLFIKALLDEKKEFYKAAFMRCAFVLIFSKSIIDVIRMAMNNWTMSDLILSILVNCTLGFVGGLLFGLGHDKLTDWLGPDHWLNNSMVYAKLKLGSATGDMAYKSY